MDEVKNRATVREDLEKRIQEMQQKSREANEAISEGRGCLTLEIPFTVGDREFKELRFDFTKMTGLQFTEAMDSDPNASMIYKITYRQALALFAISAAQETGGCDKRDIEENLGGTDAAEGVQMAMLFFTATVRAGRMRISKG